MAERVVFWGATGQARVVRDCLPPGSALVALFDNDTAVASPFADVPLFRGEAGFTAWRAGAAGDVAAIVTIGGTRGETRLRLQGWLESHGVPALTVVHRTAFVAPGVELGAGSQILAMAAVAVDARLGRACIVNTSASVDHECVLGDGVHVAPGARLAGLVTVGRGAFIGTGAVVIPRVRIGDGAQVGAGAVVVRDVPARAVVAGNPARFRRQVRVDEQ